MPPRPTPGGSGENTDTKSGTFQPNKINVRRPVLASGTICSSSAGEGRLFPEKSLMMHAEVREQSTARALMRAATGKTPRGRPKSQ